MFFLPRSFSIVVFLVSPDISAPKINNQYTCAHTHTHTLKLILPTQLLLFIEVIILMASPLTLSAAYPPKSKILHKIQARPRGEHRSPLRFYPSP